MHAANSFSPTTPEEETVASSIFRSRAPSDDDDDDDKATPISSERLEIASNATRTLLAELWRSGTLLVNDRSKFRAAVKKPRGAGEGEDQVLHGFERARAVFRGLTTTDDVAAAEELLRTEPFAGEITIQRALDVFREQYPYYSDKCDHCGATGTEFVGDAAPTPREATTQRANRVELRHCPACGSVTRFVRANAVRTVLFEHRRGRCGEYSAAFAAVLFALGLDCRWVYDTTDHVWNEVKVGNDWLHVDPCEAAFDLPLLYSQNWGKTAGCLVLGFDMQSGSALDLTSKYYPDQPAVAKHRADLGLADTDLAALLASFSIR
mmetsp:Transcript_18710/g.57545  ORF Transcript_18710/g.57545 Transcript_18710/m.57545 type:complete len:322 (-) Transcript_18710:1189-2154(-)